jgi:DNA-3-methyladenine glycosylase
VKGNSTERAIAPPGHDVPAGFFSQDVETVARGLIGITLLVNGVGGPIVETEAYDAADPASHSYRGRSARNGSAFGPPGYAYVYRSYGIHWCLNLVCGAEVGAVLIRALQPIDGVNVMAERRETTDPRGLCSGPGRLCQALGIDGTFDGRPLDESPFNLAGISLTSIKAGPRIGITRKGNVLALLAGRASLREPPSAGFAQGENTPLIPIECQTHERFKRDGINSISIRTRAQSLCPASPIIVGVTHDLCVQDRFEPGRLAQACGK